jgi:hydrogenase expression/formation protein HypE
VNSENEPKIVTLAHGSGGEEMRSLITGCILPRFRNKLLEQLGDSAVFDIPPGGRLAFTTDSYVVDPVFFPGGDIGYLSVCGTVNDLAVSGARPVYISAGLIIEEGFPFADLEKVLDSMARAADQAGVQLVTGDTKVVARGSADRIFINTAGVGVVKPGVELAPERCRPGDQVIVSGPVGTHGIAIVVARKDFGLEADLESDVAPLAGQVQALIKAAPGVRMMRDPTRGGIAGVLAEIAERAGVGVELEEVRIPVLDAVRGACEILGFEPLFLANEGIFLAVVPPQETASAVEALHQQGAVKATCIGTLVEDELKTVTVRSLIGGRRVVIPLGGELLPRIC